MIAQKILRAIFLGPTSIGRSGQARRSGPRPLAAKLELTTISPGIIAAAAVLVHNFLKFFSTANHLTIGTVSG